MKHEKKILGVCAWLAEKFEFDVSGVRLIFIIAAFFSVGTWILIYLALYLVKPKD